VADRHGLSEQKAEQVKPKAEKEEPPRIDVRCLIA
jgi:hypothetical protein